MENHSLSRKLRELAIRLASTYRHPFNREKRLQFRLPRLDVLAEHDYRTPSSGPASGDSLFAICIAAGWRHPFNRDKRRQYEAKRLASQGNMESRGPVSASSNETLENDEARSPVSASSSETLDTLTVPVPYAKALYLKRCDLAVFRVMNEGAIDFPVFEAPFFSVVISAFNNFRYTIRVLELLEYAVRFAKEKKGLEVEIVVVDNGSGDETIHISDFVKGAVFERVAPNIGFPRACNLGASIAKGEYLIFLNNDMELGADVFIRLYDAVQRDKAEVACFGAAILQFDGTFQDLGSGIWRDGVAQGYFRNEPPTRYAYGYPRDVDYVAGCFFCISAAEFREFKGFDECFSPGYYEETDLSLRLWRAGRRSRVYPEVRVYHLEYGAFSAERPRASIELMERNKPIFVQKHKDILGKRPPITHAPGYSVRYDNNRPSLLFVEDRIPSRRTGSGLGRAELIVHELIKMVDVELFACYQFGDDALPDGFNYLSIWYGPEPSKLEEILQQRHYDIIYVCRPHNISRYKTVLRDWKRGGGCIIYDTEAIYSVREISQEQRLESYAEIASSPKFAELLGVELEPAEIADVLIAVNEHEKAILRENLPQTVHNIGHYMSIRPTAAGVDDRSGLLFVGSLLDVKTPNYDSLVWFLDNVWPKIRAARSEETLRIVGYMREETPLEPLLRDGVTFVGHVQDLTDEYARARVFVAPTRFAAGVPFKVHEAFSFGLPVVTSLLIGEQVAIDGSIGGSLAATVMDDGAAYAEACLRLLADDDLWRQKRAAALDYMEAYCAPAMLEGAVDRLVRAIVPQASNLDGSPVLMSPSPKVAAEAGSHP